MINLEVLAKNFGNNKAIKTSNGWLTCCPAHDDKSPSLSLSIDSNDKLLVHCFAGCSYQDIITVIKGDRTLGKISNKNLQKNISNNQPQDWSEKAEYIWQKAVSFYGTAVEKYLQFRGCKSPNCKDLRYLPTYKEKPHAMLARITDTITGKPISLHFTYLESSGYGKANIEKPKSLLSGHRKKGGVIRLFPDEEIVMGLGITEGIETALSVAKYWNPVWSAIDSGNISEFPVLEGIECLTIFADNDNSGLKSAEECQYRWIVAGKKSHIISPSSLSADWNDVAGRVIE